jgi:hypothetical protein
MLYLMLLALLVGQGSPTIEFTVSNFKTSADLRAACTYERVGQDLMYLVKRSECVSYIMAVVDAHENLKTISGAVPRFCMPSRTTAQVPIDEVTRWLRTRPGPPVPASEGVFEALSQKFACR